MPYTVAITADEATLLTEAKIDGVEGSIFTYEPRDSLCIMEIVGNICDPEALGIRRLKDRLATLYGTWLATVARKRESEQASDADVFVTRISADTVGDLTGTGYITPGAIIDPDFDGPQSNPGSVGGSYENPVNVPNVLGVDIGLDEAPSPAPAPAPKTGKFRKARR